MQISYQDTHFSFTGFWQENYEGELVSYKRVAMAAVSFLGTEVLVNARLDGTAKWYVDDVLENEDIEEKYVRDFLSCSMIDRNSNNFEIDKILFIYKYGSKKAKKIAVDEKLKMI